jgi:hypothetical protein
MPIASCTTRPSRHWERALPSSSKVTHDVSVPHHPSGHTRRWAVLADESASMILVRQHEHYICAILQHAFLRRSKSKYTTGDEFHQDSWLSARHLTNARRLRAPSPEITSCHLSTKGKHDLTIGQSIRTPKSFRFEHAQYHLRLRWLSALCLQHCHSNSAN